MVRALYFGVGLADKFKHSFTGVCRLFPMGDMPEILHTLIAKGRAILWSSQEKEGYKVTVLIVFNCELAITVKPVHAFTSFFNLRTNKFIHEILISFFVSIIC